MGQTQNKETIIETNVEEKSEKSFEQTITENTKKVLRMLPWWAWLVIAWLLRRHIVNVVGVFYPPVRGIKSIKDLFTPPNKAHK